MLRMFTAMTISAQNFKIRQIIIMWIFILMMHTKNPGFLIKSASIACLNQSTFPHHLSDCRERWFECFMRVFINACPRAIFTIMTSMANKFLKAMLASIFSFTFIPLSHIVARCRAILGFITPRGYMGKALGADKTICCNLSSFGFSFAA